MENKLLLSIHFALAVAQILARVIVHFQNQNVVVHFQNQNLFDLKC